MQRYQKIFKNYRIALWVLIILLGLGFVFELLYHYSSRNAVSVKNVERIIEKKEQKSDALLVKITDMLKRGSEDSLRWLISKPLPASYYVFKDDKFVFWTDNKIRRVIPETDQWRYYAGPNAHVLGRSVTVNEYKVISLIFLKYKFPYENNELSNDFIPELKLDKSIEIVDNAPKDKYAVYDNDGKNYLFSLKLPSHNIYNEKWAIAALVIFTIAFFLLFFLYAHAPFLWHKRHLTIKDFFLTVLFMSVLVVVCLSTNIPSTYFLNNITTAYNYAGNTLLATLTHVTFLTVFVFSTVYLYVYFLKRGIETSFVGVKRAFLLLLPSVYYIVFFYILKGLVFNSSTYLNVLRVDDLTRVSVWNHILLLIWGVGYLLLFIKMHQVTKEESGIASVIKTDVFILIITVLLCFVSFGKYASYAVFFYVLMGVALYVYEVFSPKAKLRYYLPVFVGLLSLFVVVNSIRMNVDKKEAQFKLLAENLYFNETSQEERYTLLMIRDLEENLLQDSYFQRTVVAPDSVVFVNDYLNERYFRGFWNKYEMKLVAVFPDSEDDKLYKDLISSLGNRIADTHFYRMNNMNTYMRYLAFYTVVNKRSEPVNVYMEFYPKSNYKSFSYPSLLMESPPTIQSQLSLSVAKYAYGELEYSTGKFSYPSTGKWINKSDKSFFIQDLSAYRHYVYSPSKNIYMVVSEGQIPGLTAYLLYFLYTFISFLLITLLLLWVNKLISSRKKVKYNLTSKLFISFISLMTVCFAAISFVTFNYTEEKYKERQLYDISLKKNYIQNALQEKYYWAQQIDSTLTGRLNFDLQDLAYTYQTDINIYDNNGMLVGSSQPVIFTRNLTSRLIAPKPYFSNSPNIAENEHIGNLEYLSTYADFYNGEYLQLGFINIPQFLSEDEFKADVQSFIVVIAHISLIIIVLFIIISFLIGRRLTAPLRLIEERLKFIKLGKLNKKIDYRGNDEIGELVAQYNRTVEELERSALLLASSEREAAFKQMARQVAHEINNPLTPMKLTIQQLQRAKTIDEERFNAYFDKSTSVLIEQIDNLSRIAGSFSSFARLPDPKFEEVDVAKKAHLVTQLFMNNNESINIHYVGVEEGIFVYSDREQLIQVFNNLLKNATQSIPKGKKGEITVTLNYTDKMVHVYVRDNGKGVPEEIKEKIFMPNFTTKSAGMGLGLAISLNIIRNSGGDITFESSIGGGTVFHVQLPRI